MKAGILGVGAAVPEQVITNADWEERLDTSDAWIQRRTGIKERRWLREGETMLPLAVEASRIALADAGRDASEIDHVVVSTVQSDDVTPGTSPLLASELGTPNAGALDINGACAGFMHALDHAASLVETGRSKLALVCASEPLSRLADVTDRATAVLFGDGAGAVVIGPGDFPLGIGPMVLGSDGAKRDMLYAPRETGFVVMEGQAVYRQAIRRMSETAREALERAHLQIEDVDLLIAHQANQRIVEIVARDLGVPEERVVFNTATTANTSSASIPMAMAAAQEQGRLQPGMTLAFAAFGAGFVYGAGISGFKEQAA